MALKRNAIAMSDAEIQSYLASSNFVVLVTNGAGGFPHPMPMNYVWKDGCFLMTTFRKSQKVKNLERDPRASLLVESGGDYYDQIKSVIAYANAEIVDDLETTRQVMTWGAEASPRDGPFSEDARKAIVDLQAPKRLVLRFKPDNFVSWDHSKLQGQY